MRRYRTVLMGPAYGTHRINDRILSRISSYRYAPILSSYLRRHLPTRAYCISNLYRVYVYRGHLSLESFYRVALFYDKRLTIYRFVTFSPITGHRLVSGEILLMGAQFAEKRITLTEFQIYFFEIIVIMVILEF